MNGLKILLALLVAVQVQSVPVSAQMMAGKIQRDSQLSLTEQQLSWVLNSTTTAAYSVLHTNERVLPSASEVSYTELVPTPSQAQISVFVTKSSPAAIESSAVQPTKSALGPRKVPTTEFDQPIGKNSELIAPSKASYTLTISGKHTEMPVFKPSMVAVEPTDKTSLQPSVIYEQNKSINMSAVEHNTTETEPDMTTENVTGEIIDLNMTTTKDNMTALTNNMSDPNTTNNESVTEMTESVSQERFVTIVGNHSTPEVDMSTVEPAHTSLINASTTLSLIEHELLTTECCYERTESSETVLYNSRVVNESLLIRPSTIVIQTFTSATESRVSLIEPSKVVQETSEMELLMPMEMTASDTPLVMVSEPTNVSVTEILPLTVHEVQETLAVTGAGTELPSLDSIQVLISPLPVSRTHSVPSSFTDVLLSSIVPSLHASPIDFLAFTSTPSLLQISEGTVDYLLPVETNTPGASHPSPAPSLPSVTHILSSGGSLSTKPSLTVDVFVTDVEILPTPTTVDMVPDSSLRLFTTRQPSSTVLLEQVYTNILSLSSMYETATLAVNPTLSSESVVPTPEMLLPMYSGETDEMYSSTVLFQTTSETIKPQLSSKVMNISRLSTIESVGILPNVSSYQVMETSSFVIPDVSSSTNSTIFSSGYETLLYMQSSVEMSTRVSPTSSVVSIASASSTGTSGVVSVDTAMTPHQPMTPSYPEQTLLSLEALNMSVQPTISYVQSVLSVKQTVFVVSPTQVQSLLPSLEITTTLKLIPTTAVESTSFLMESMVSSATHTGVPFSTAATSIQTSSPVIHSQILSTGVSPSPSLAQQVSNLVEPTMNLSLSSTKGAQTSSTVILSRTILNGTTPISSVIKSQAVGTASIATLTPLLSSSTEVVNTTELTTNIVPITSSVESSVVEENRNSVPPTVNSSFHVPLLTTSHSSTVPHVTTSVTSELTSLLSPSPLNSGCFKTTADVVSSTQEGTSEGNIVSKTYISPGVRDESRIVTAATTPVIITTSTPAVSQSFSLVPTPSVVTSTPSLCSELDFTPPSDTVVSIILAIPPSALSRILEVGSIERCQLLEALSSVYLRGLMNQGQVNLVMKRGVSEKVREGGRNNRHGRQMSTGSQYTAVITGITEADGIGDNLVDVMFSILDTSDPASPQSLHSTAVSESFEQANVNEISGYTVVRPARPSESTELVESSEETGLSSRGRVGVIVAAAVLTALVAVGLLIAVMALLWKQNHRGKFRLQSSSRIAGVSLLSRTLVPTTSFEYESQPIVQQLGSSPMRSHDITESSHDSCEGSKDSEGESGASLAEIAHVHHYQERPRRTGSVPDQVVTTLTHLAHSISSESVQVGQSDTAPKDNLATTTVEMFEKVTHYDSLHLQQRPPHHLPPLKPRFHYTPSHPSQQAPDSPHHSPSPTSTFRRIPTATPPKQDGDRDMVTPNPRRKEKKKKRRRQHSNRTRGRPNDEGMTVQLLMEQPQTAVNQPETTVNEEEQELWHRRRATMEYHKYISGEESTFHPSFLSYKTQTPVPGTPGLPMTGTPTHLAYEFPVSSPGSEESDRESLVMEDSADEGLSESNAAGIDSRHWERDDKQTKCSDAPPDRDSERKQQNTRSRGSKHYRRSRKVAPLPYATSLPVSPNQGADLAWMDTVNGPQLMSIMPVSIHQSPPQQQAPGPQFVLPSPRVAPATVFYHHPPPHGPPQSHLTPRRAQSVTGQHHSAGTKPHATEDRGESEGGASRDSVDGPDETTGEQSGAQEQGLAKRSSTEEPKFGLDEKTFTTSAAIHDHTDRTATDLPVHDQADQNTAMTTPVPDQADPTAATDATSTARPQHQQNTVQKMLREAFNTSPTQKSSEDAVDGSQDERQGSKKFLSQKPPQRVIAVPLHVQQFHAATHPGPFQLVLPSATQQVLQAPVMFPYHSGYYHSQPRPPYLYHHQGDLATYFSGNPLSPSYTSTPHYRVHSSKQH